MFAALRSSDQFAPDLVVTSNTLLHKGDAAWRLVMTPEVFTERMTPPVERAVKASVLR